MADDQRRVTVERIATGEYVARNARGGELRFGSRAGEAFTPVELLLAAIAGCSAIDVDLVTTRRAEPEEWGATVDARVIRDELGQRLTDIALTFGITFPEGEKGDQARDALPRAVKTSHDRSCTVSRTIEVGTPITSRAE